MLKGDIVTDHATGMKPILLNDFRRQWVDTAEDVLTATRRTGESGWYILGQEVDGFEHDLAAYVNRRHVIGCANGLDAIEIGLRAMGIRPGDKVLTTALSAFATTLAIIRAGGTPVFIDVDEYGLLDLELARQALNADRTIRYFVPVHLFGHALDLERLARIKQDFDVRILEDCCQAIGAAWGDLPVGSVGEVSALSFYPTKNLGALGDGGAVLTDDSNHNTVCRSLRDYGQVSRYRHDELGLNSRLDEMHAAILKTAFLPRLGKWTQRRRYIAQSYLANIQNANVNVPGAPTGSTSVWHLFPVLVAPAHREHFRAHLNEAGVYSAIHYPELISRQQALSGCTFEVFRMLTTTERYCGSEVSLPIHPYMSDSEIERVVSAVNTWSLP